MLPKLQPCGNQEVASIDMQLIVSLFNPNELKGSYFYLFLSCQVSVFRSKKTLREVEFVLSLSLISLHNAAGEEPNVCSVVTNLPKKARDIAYGS